MKKILLAAALAALASLAFAGSALGVTKKTQVAAFGFESGDDDVAVIGTMRSGSDRCLSSRKVALVAERDGDDKLLGTDVSSRNGGFSFIERVPADATNLLVAVKGKRISKRLNCGRTAAEVRPGSTSP